MKCAILFGLFLVSSIGIAGCQDQGKGSADGSNESGPVRTACKDEIEKFCQGEKRAGRCLRERNSADLSQTCSTALNNRGSSR